MTSSNKAVLLGREISRRRHEEIGDAPQYHGPPPDIAARDRRLKLVDQRPPRRHGRRLRPNAPAGGRHRDEFCSRRFIGPRDQFEGGKVEFRQRPRPAEQITLNVIDAMGPQQFELRIRFHAFGGHGNFQPAGERQDRRHHGHAIGSRRQVPA